MQGVNYITDNKGDKKAVIIDLKPWGKLWEDFYDVMVSESRKDEKDIPWDEARKELLKDA